ncbi:MAG TPA: hypothetical protein PKZ76_18955 [Xanthomonadaceae bacterium]|nr:hypothetical protein [Xanthomonadaceae bacterium]
MSKLTCVVTVVASVMFAGCSSGPPPAKEFASGARAPSAAELTAALHGKSFTYSPGSLRTDYAAQGNGIVVYYGAGNSDSGTWRAEDGRVCFQFKVLPSGCNDIRYVGKDLYLKRMNGEVVRLGLR